MDYSENDGKAKLYISLIFHQKAKKLLSDLKIKLHTFVEHSFWISSYPSLLFAILVIKQCSLTMTLAYDQ